MMYKHYSQVQYNACYHYIAYIYHAHHIATLSKYSQHKILVVFPHICQNGVSPVITNSRRFTSPFALLSIGFFISQLHSGAPLPSKFGNLRVSIRNILVVTSAYARPPVQTLGEGEGSLKTTLQGMQNAIFSWREIARSFWATGVFLSGKSNFF